MVHYISIYSIIFDNWLRITGAVMLYFLAWQNNAVNKRPFLLAAFKGHWCSAMQSGDTSSITLKLNLALSLLLNFYFLIGRNNLSTVLDPFVLLD